MNYCHASFGCDCQDELGGLKLLLDEKNKRLEEVEHAARMAVRAYDTNGMNGDSFGVWFEKLRHVIGG